MRRRAASRFSAARRAASWSIGDQATSHSRELTNFLRIYAPAKLFRRCGAGLAKWKAFLGLLATPRMCDSVTATRTTRRSLSRYVRDDENPVRRKKKKLKREKDRRRETEKTDYEGTRETERRDKGRRQREKQRRAGGRKKERGRDELRRSR